MIMGLGGHWIFKFWGRYDVFIGNTKRKIPYLEGCNPDVAYTKLALYLANRINRDRLMMTYARKKGHSINSKKGRKPRITYVTFDEKRAPVAVTLGRCASRRYLDGKPWRKCFKSAR